MQKGDIRFSKWRLTDDVVSKLMRYFFPISRQTTEMLSVARPAVVVHSLLTAGQTEH